MISITLQDDIDNIYKKYCYGCADDFDIPKFLDFSSILNNNITDINTICEEIGLSYVFQLVLNISIIK